MNALANGDWVGWIIGLLAVVLAIFFYFRSRATTQLVCQWSGRHLVGGEEADLPDEVLISYKGANVPRLSSAEVVFWNSGKLTARGADIVEADPLRIVLPQDAKILRATLTSVTRGVNAFSVKVHDEKPNEAICTFDFLDPGDGARIKLLHTSKERHPKMIGTIRGLPSGIGDWGRVQQRSYRPRILGFSLRQLVLIPTILGFVGALIGVFLPIIQVKFRRWPSSLQISREGHIAMIIVGILYMLPGIVLLWAGRRRFPRPLSEDE